MDEQTERMIRSYIRLRLMPLYLALWLLLGSIVGFGMIGALGFLDRFVRAPGFPH